MGYGWYCPRNGSGTWYFFDGERIGQGRENAKNFLKEHPDVFACVLEKLRDALKLVQKETKGPEIVVNNLSNHEDSDDALTPFQLGCIENPNLMTGNSSIKRGRRVFL